MERNRITPSIIIDSQSGGFWGVSPPQNLERLILWKIVTIKGMKTHVRGGQNWWEKGVNFQRESSDMFVGHTLSFEDIRIKTVNETTFLRKDYQNALNELENESKVFIDGKGRKGAIKDESMVSFDPKIIDERMTEVKKNGDNKKTKSQCTFDEF